MRLRDRAQPGAVRSCRHAASRCCRRVLGPLRRHGAGALRADPRSDRGRRLRRVHRPGPGATWRKAPTAARILVAGPRPQKPGHGRTPVTASDAAVRCRRVRKRARSRSPDAAAAGETGCRHVASRPTRRGSAARFDVAQAQDPGGWFVAGASDDVGAQPLGHPDHRGPRGGPLAGRVGGPWSPGPGACPHLGALLEGCPVLDGDVVLPLARPRPSARPGARLEPVPAHDDGVLLWVRLPTEGETPTDRPTLPRGRRSRVGHRGDREPGVCEPQDVIANRLDPWHGALVPPVRVQPPGRRRRGRPTTTPRGGRDLPAEPHLGRARSAPSSACPDARTIVMRIVDGEGTGSVVETHATPLAPTTGPAADHGDRGDHRPLRPPGFRVARWVTALLKPADPARPPASSGSTTSPTPSAATILRAARRFLG